MRALVVEDDQRLRSLVVRSLTRVGLACDEASRVAEADESLGIHQYDLLVLDRRLPDGDGLAICKRARSNGFTNSILMLTALDDPESTVEGLSEAPTITWASPSTWTFWPPGRARSCAATSGGRPPSSPAAS